MALVFDQYAYTGFFGIPRIYISMYALIKAGYFDSNTRLLLGWRVGSPVLPWALLVLAWFDM